MQTFAEYMAESFRSNSRLVWNLATASHVTASFGVDSVRVLVSFERREPDGPWHVPFEVDRGEKTEIAHAAFAIFNGVFQAVQEFIEVREPEALVFATKRDGLADIYRTYLGRESAVLKKLGYGLEGPLRVEPYTEFLLRRIPPSAWRN